MLPESIELALKDGRTDEAEAICRQTLAASLACPAAHNLLGLLLRARGKPLEAVAAHRLAIELQPGSWQFHDNLGVALTDAGLLAEAVEAFGCALELARDEPQVLGNLGVVLTQLGRLEQARAVLVKAVSLLPDSFQLHYNLGNALLAAGRIDEAIGAYRNATRLDPARGQAWCNLGVALRSAGDLRDAVASHQRAVELMPASAEAHLNLGVALDAAGQSDRAIAAYRRAIEVNPNLAQAHYNLANALSARGDLKEAIAAYQQAVELRPDLVPAHSNHGRALMRIGAGKEAMKAYERAIELDPRSAEARWNRALALLLAGDYARGWPEYEWRNRLDPPSSQPFCQPQWRGEPLAGRTILLHAEHGLGDTVQFVRYVPRVAAMGGRVTLRCQAELRELLEGLAGVDRLIAEGDPLPAFDLHCPLMSLPLAFGTRIDSIPNAVPYIAPDPRRAEQWKTRLARHVGVRRVGLAWAGRPQHQYDRQRSISLSALAPLSRVPGVRFFSLQKGGASAQAQIPPAGMDLVDYSAALNDYADTAALICQLDLVIVVDTSVAHVAAALGKPVWLLLAFAPDWRWLLDRPDSPWYPTMRLFRQTSRNDWTPVVEQVSEALSH